MHDHGIKTWASIEPVIIPEQSLQILEMCSPYVDGFKIGKLNHFEKFTKDVNWAKFLEDAVAIMRKNKKLFYIKKDLLAFKPKHLKLEKHETEMDFMAIPNRFASKAQSVLF
jgi:predicted nucleotidyltransferase